MNNIKSTIATATVALALAAAPAYGAGPALFSESFDTQDDFNRWTIINVLEGSVTWTYRDWDSCAQILIHREVPAEDWLISPEFNLEAGNVYEISFKMTPGVYNRRESMKAYMGRGATAADMTDLLISIEEVIRDNSADNIYKIDYPAPEDGSYRIGFLACSQPDRGRIEVDDVNVTLKKAVPTPGVPTDLQATTSEEGGRSVKLSFRAPTVNAQGEWLDSISGINIRRNGVLINTISPLIPGSQHEFTDTEVPDGEVTYAVSGFSGKEGKAATAMLYFGTDIPCAPLAPRAVFDGEKIRLTWQAPAEGAHNGTFDPAALTYAVTMQGSNTPLATVSGTTYDYPVDPANPQQFYNFAVAATSTAGTGESAPFSAVLAGKAIDAPLSESFNGTPANPWYTDPTEGAFPWTAEGGLTAETAQGAEGSSSRFVSPLVNLSTLANPVLRFSLKGGATDRLALQVRTPGTEWQEMPAAEWEGDSECMIPFTQRGNVQFAFVARGGGEPISIGNVRIQEAGWTSDVAITSATASTKRATVGEATRFTATLRNLGAQAASDYTLTLLRDGEEVATVEGPALQPAEIFPYTILYTATYDDQYKEKSQWTFRLDSKGDQRPQNDVSEALVWSTRGHDVPAPAGLDAQCSAEGVTLTWDTAEDVEEGVQGSPIVVNDDFESYEPFLKDQAGAWTIRDLDKAPTWYAFYPEFSHKGEPMAFQVFNTEMGGTQTPDFLDQLFNAHSGKQYMLCVGNDDIGIPNDDWLITPRLDGRAQTIRFYCSTPQPFNRPDKMRVGFSTTDTHPDSFTMLGEYTLGDGDRRWSFDIPEGARYFAINVTYCNMFIKIDDVTYTRWDGRPDPLTVEGYNVYRDGLKLNAEPLSEPLYKDAEAKSGTTYTYAVTTVYEQGESAYSQPLTLTADLSAIEGINADAPTETGRFTPDGLPAPANYRGTVIIRYSDGTTRKAIAR